MALHLARTGGIFFLERYVLGAKPECIAEILLVI